MRLLGERRYGELLGPARVGANQHTEGLHAESPRDHNAEHRARQVAAVPEPVFDEYVEQAEQPTRAGLLRG